MPRLTLSTATACQSALAPLEASQMGYLCLAIRALWSACWRMMNGSFLAAAAAASGAASGRGGGSRPATKQSGEWCARNSLGKLSLGMHSGQVGGQGECLGGLTCACGCCVRCVDAACGGGAAGPYARVWCCTVLPRVDARRFLTRAGQRTRVAGKVEAGVGPQLPPDRGTASCTREASSPPSLRTHCLLRSAQAVDPHRQAAHPPAALLRLPHQRPHHVRRPSPAAVPAAVPRCECLCPRVRSD